MYKHLEQFFKDTCILSVRCITSNTVSLAQHIIRGPVRHIVGITFTVVQGLLGLKLPQGSNRKASNFASLRMVLPKWQNGFVSHYEFGKLAGQPFQKTKCMSGADLGGFLVSRTPFQKS